MSDQPRDDASAADQPVVVLRADLQRVRGVLIEAELTEPPGERHAAAQRAALGVAAVLLALRGARVRTRRDVWQLLASAAPEYAEWAGFFAATAQVPGRPRAISAREADDLVRDAGAFAELVGSQVATLAQRRTAPGGAGLVDGGASRGGLTG